MADVGASLAVDAGKDVGQAVVNRVKASIVAQNKEQYNEDDIKATLLSELQQIQEDTNVLRNVDFKTARDALEFWHQSEEAIDSQYRLSQLRLARDKAMSAFHAVPDPIDKVMSVIFKVFADYHLVALQTSPPNWAAGKRQAQNLLQDYINKIPQLDKAAKEELKLVRRPMFKDKLKRRNLLQAFVTLYYTVFDFAPASMNKSRPKFVRLEEAATSSTIKSLKQGGVAISPMASHLLTEPLELFTLEGHTYTNSVTCCAVLANDTRAISGSDDNTLKVWDLDNRQELFTLEGHKSHWVNCCAVFANDTRAISGIGGIFSGTLKVWDLVNRQELFTLKGHTGGVRCCAVFANDTRAISGSFDNTLKAWNLANRRELFTLKGHTEGVSCCAVFANNTRAISGSWDSTLKVWDLVNRQELFTLEGHTEPVFCCAVFANDTRAISGSWDNTLKVWDLVNRQELFTLEGHSEEVLCCAVFANDTRAISGSWDHTLKVWDLVNRQELFTLKGHTEGVSCCAVFANDTRAISGGGGLPVLLGSGDHTLKVWALPAPEAG